MQVLKLCTGTCVSFAAVGAAAKKRKRKQHDAQHELLLFSSMATKATLSVNVDTLCSHSLLRIISAFQFHVKAAQ